MTTLDEALRALVNTIIRDCCESETSDPERDDTIMIREGTLREILERALLTTRQEVAPVAWGLMYPDDHAQRGQLWNVAVEKESAEQMQSACWNAGYDVIVPLYTSTGQTSPEVAPVADDEAVEVVVCELGDYGPVDREMVTVLFDDMKIAECYRAEDAEYVAAALREYSTGQTSDARDGLRAACERACRELPEGWAVRVCLERDAGTVELSDPNGYTANIDEDGDDRIVAEINAAIGLAMQEAGK